MKILWFAHRDIKHPKAGGAERTIYEVGKRFVKLGADVNLVTVNSGHLLNYEIFDGIKTYRIKGNIKAHLNVKKMIKKIDPDVIIDDMGHAIPWCSPWFTHKKVIVFFRHLHARSLPGQVNIFLAKIITFIEKMYPFIYKNNIFVTESDTSEDDLIHLGIKKENIVRIPPGVDLNLFHAGEKTKNVQLLYFGGLRKYKRPEYAIRVYEELYNKIQNLKLVITGNGPMLNKMKDDVKNKNYNIDFLGKIDYNELSKIIRESWVNLHFSVTEGWGYSILESSASGTPTVAFRVPGVIDTIKNNFNGFLVNDISEFRDKILYIIKNEDLFIKNSRKFAEDFTWDKTAEMWYKLLNND
ncbi:MULTISPECIES: glycosyltransferase family 4 protein [unclassified Acidiplasma]|uniref:glycosyltransferase family 4 protein n=1 Tax=unclassified Acidiplasma TaxID=2641301 RepID=UPI0005E1344C|nr:MULTISPECIES: glycosyltransferase family 4 protein [unclassified Acidiplasma]KJE48770.1 glycosyltransferase [Acidiplasma sp. MBA-1]WMT55545.1 MAG: glycosyltransferase family 4 protein [Acidiplasma sp.]